MPAREPTIGDDATRSDLPLVQAAARGDWERVYALLEGGAAADEVDAAGCTPLTTAALYGHADIVDVLLDRGAAVDRQDRDGNTALLLAAQRGHRDVVQALLLRKSTIDHTNRKGQTALFLAAACPVLRDTPSSPLSRHKGHDEVVRALLADFANTEDYEIGGLQPVSAAAVAGNVAATLDLLEAGARFLSDEIVGPNLLRAMAEQGNVAALRELLDRGAEFFYIDDARDPWNRTALTCAAGARQYSTARELLDRGAAVSDADRALFDGWLQWLEAEAERAYDQMYEAASNAAATGPYSNAKEFLADAIGLTRRLGRKEQAAELQARLNHIKNVFRSQFG
jgi:ankyrin repeat protein